MDRNVIATISLVLGICCTKILADPPLPFEVRRVGDTEFAKDEINFRLPNTTAPESYNIVLQTDIAEGRFEFNGFVQITLSVLAKTNNITLHARELRITNVKLINLAGSGILDVTHDFDRKTEFLTITTPDVLNPPQKLILEIKYIGRLRNDTGGFYASSYINENGKKMYEFLFIIFQLNEKISNEIIIAIYIFFVAVG